MTHAEMTAICDAARLGRSAKNAIMYVTTFPCHNCAKHIIASGIRRVVFIEPYLKSKAAYSHDDSISIGQKVDGKVLLEHFIGISPRRYRDIFEKGKRRRTDGTIKEWNEEIPIPIIGYGDLNNHITNEPHAIMALKNVKI
jgi:deoxycytidylate deaminase